MNRKTRVRTIKELLVRKKEFLLICKILDNLKINYFLQTGILLGAIRDNDFIKWDWDIEISVFAEEFYPYIDIIAKKLKKNNFNIIKIIKDKKKAKIDFYGKYPIDVTGYTIFAWNYSRRNDFFWRNEFKVPSEFLKKLSTINFLGRQFKCPNNPQEYLKYAYGNWRKPLKTSNKALYFSKKFRNNNKYLFISITQIIKKILYFFFKRIMLFYNQFFK